MMSIIRYLAMMCLCSCLLLRELQLSYTRAFQIVQTSATVKDDDQQQPAARVHADDELQTMLSLLNQNADEKKRVVIAGVSSQHLDFVFNFVVSLERNGVTNYLLVPMDEPSHKQLTTAYPNRTLAISYARKSSSVKTQNNSSKKTEYGSVSPPTIIASILERGFTVLYNRVDCVWHQAVLNEWDHRGIKDENTRLILLTNKDDTNAISIDERESLRYSTSLIYVEPSPRSIWLMRDWQTAIQKSGGSTASGDYHHGDKHEEYLFNRAFQKFKDSSVFLDTEWNEITPENGFFSGHDLLSSLIDLGRNDGNQTMQMVHDLSNAWPPVSILDRIADNKKRFVVVGVTCGVLEMADNFVQSMERNGGVANYLMVPLDPQAHDILSRAYPNHTLPMMPGVANAPVQAHYGSKKDFKAITATRPVFLSMFLARGYSVMYSDVDRVWFQNVWSEFDRLQAESSNVTLILVDDEPHPDNDKKESPHYTTSLMYLEPTDRNMKLLRKWRNAIVADPEDRNGGDQGYFNEVFRNLKRDHFFHEDEWTKAYTGDFPTGKDFFLNYKNYSDYKHNIQTVHANFIVGKWTKRQFIMDHGLWNLSGRIPENIECTS